MAERVDEALRAFPRLTAALAAGADDAPALTGRICTEVGRAFGLSRVDFVWPGELTTRHPLVERADAEGRAVGDGQRVAAPLRVDGRTLGFVLGDRAGRTLALDDGELRLLAALADVAAAFLDRAAAVGRLRRSLDARNEFVSLAAHELRTGIGVVHGIVATLHARGKTLSPTDTQELTAAAFEQTSRVTRLTEQLLDLSRLEAGAVAAEVRHFRPRELVELLVRRLFPDRTSDFTVEIAPQTELSSDPEALERVLTNLLVNALRYGKPPVRVRCGDESCTALIVEDAGAGVPLELVPALFERFTRGRADLGGSGLGLAVARSYAALIGAELTYEPRHPSGARFLLRLPPAAAALVTHR